MNLEQLAEALAKLSDKDRALVAELEEDAATRIAEKRAEQQQVWWTNKHTKSRPAHAQDYEESSFGEIPYTIIDSRIVGETPEDELDVLGQWTGIAIEDSDTPEQRVRVDKLERLYDRLRKTNAAIAAARKDGE